MSLPKMWKVSHNMMLGNIIAIAGSLSLAAAFFSGCENTGRNHPQMDQSQVQLAIAFPEWSRTPSKSKVVLTFSNPTAQPRTVVLPCPLNENTTSFGTPEKPVLVLTAKEPLTSSEREFALTDWSNGTSDQSKTLTLKPGERADVPFPLASIYSWGHAGPIKNMRFLDCLRPGEHEVAVRATIAYSDVEHEKVNHISFTSPSVVLKCVFPKWLFKTKAEKAERSSDTGTDSHK